MSGAEPTAFETRAPAPVGPANAEVDVDPTAGIDVERALEAGDSIAAPVPAAAAAVPTIAQRGGDIPREAVAADAGRLGVEPVVAHLLRARGIVEHDAQARVLEPSLSQLRSPENMAGFPAALELLHDAIAAGRRIGVFGDYDVDGVTTATILTTYLEALGAEVVVRVAHRDRGYGFGVADAEAFAQAGAKLVLTGDCGTSDIEALAWLKERGIPSVVIDHHQVPEVMPPADALINPHQPGCGFAFKGMCSAGVAFYLCAGLRSRLARERTSVPDPRAWLDLVALATVCDMMPLVEENRVLVRQGLRHLHRRSRPGLRALLSAAGVSADEPVDETHLGFKLGPRINAPGRLGPAEPALELLRARSDAEAGPLAERLETLNATRKRHSERTAAEAMAICAADPRTESRAAVVVAHTGWLSGIVGIAAAGLSEHYRRPALVLAIDPSGEVARGSVRSFGGVDVRAALAECSDLLERFGGHREAAGVTVAVARIDELREAFASACEAQARSAARADVEIVDATLPLRRLDLGLVDAIARLSPYGVGFDAPRLCVRGATVHTARVLKERHLSVVLEQDGSQRTGIAFSQAFHALKAGEKVGCIFAPVADRWRGETRLRLHVQRIWRE
jgi:single-stranded-DNA-specific exonuclease